MEFNFSKISSYLVLERNFREAYWNRTAKEGSYNDQLLAYLVGKDCDFDEAHAFVFKQYTLGGK